MRGNIAQMMQQAQRMQENMKRAQEELATLEVKTPGTVVLKKEGKNIIATANYGKGHVFVIGDPWLYNEYIDGRKLPAGFDNFAAANDLVKWALYHKNR